MTALKIASLAEVKQYARGALNAAGARDLVPVPIDDVIAAANLQPAEALYHLGENAPPRFRAVLSKLKDKLLAVFDQQERQIYVDATMPVPRQRFAKGHEAGHAILPWHDQAYMADDRTTLALETLQELEREANAFSAEILFAGDGFARRADDSAPGLGRPLELAEKFDASSNAALRRYAECTKHDVALLVLGRFPVTAADGSSGLKVMTRQCTQSESFERLHGPITSLLPPHLPAGRGDAITVAAQTDCGVAVETSTLTLAQTRRGGPSTFTAEVFSNGRLKFVLLYRRPLFAGPRVHAVPV